jgi:hypothetical protein
MSDSEDGDTEYTDAEQEVIDRTVAQKRAHAEMSEAEAREWAEEHSKHLFAQARKVGYLQPEDRSE